jgi:hypothetical protein
MESGLTGSGLTISVASGMPMPTSGGCLQSEQAAFVVFKTFRPSMLLPLQNNRKGKIDRNDSLYVLGNYNQTACNQSWLT